MPSRMISHWTFAARDRVIAIGVIFAAIITTAIITSEHLILVIALAAVSSMLLWPVEVSLGLFALLTPFEFTLAVGPLEAGTSLAWYIGATSGAVLLVTGIAFRKFESPPRAALWWSLLVLWAAATCLWALDPQLALARLQEAVTLLMLYVVAVSLRVTKRQLASISLLTIAGGVAAACYAVLTSQQAEDRTSLVISDRSTDPNVFSATLLLPLSFVLGRFCASQSRIERLAMVAAGGVMVIAVSRSMSRAGIFSLCVLILVYAWRYRLNRRVFFALLAFALVLVVAAPAFLYVRLENSVASRAGGRFDVWYVGLAAIERYGIWGAGFGNFSVAYSRFAGLAPVYRGITIESHNVLLALAVGLGIPGLLFFLMAVGSQLSAAWRYAAGTASNRALVPYEAACCALLAMCFSLDLFWLKAFWLAWIFLAIAVRTYESDELPAPAALETLRPWHGLA